MQDIIQLVEEFSTCQRVLTALGDENRQHLILEMIRMGKCNGVRVGEITQKTHLSRPAISHHLGVLKAAVLVKMRREGTKNYYYFDVNTEAMDCLIRMLTHAKSVMQSLPDRNGENT